MSYNSFGARRKFGGRPTFNKAQRSSGRQPKKENIHPSRFLKAAKPVEIVPFIPKHSFADFAIADLLKRNLQDKGIATPSPIQDEAIPIGLAGQDVIGIANTGTGKTIAFAIPVLNALMNDRSARALIMAPTRELAQQILEECRVVAKGSGLNGALLIGGAAMGPQLGDLRRNPRIVIGTPGRIKDHLERGSLSLDGFTIAVLDEVDRMLDMGFVNDMRLILGKIPAQRQSFFFSATMNDRVMSLVRTFMINPVTISVKQGETSENVEQNIVNYGSSNEKIEKLHDVLIDTKVAKALVFDDTQRSVERLAKELIARGFSAESIHGGRSQGQRQRALQRFKANQATILVATDVAARGIDVADITHVINYSTPQTYDDYVHRIGRAGRAGRVGHALTFIEK